MADLADTRWEKDQQMRALEEHAYKILSEPDGRFPWGHNVTLVAAQVLTAVQLYWASSPQGDTAN